MFSESVPIGCPQCAGKAVTIESIHMLLPDAPDGPANFGISALTGQVVATALTDKKIAGRHVVIRVSCANGHEFKMMLHSHGGKTMFRESAESLVNAMQPKAITAPEKFGQFLSAMFNEMLSTPPVETDILWGVILRATKEKAPLLTQWVEVGKPIFTNQPNGFRLVIINFKKEHAKIAKALRLEKESLVKIVRDAMEDQMIALEIKVA